jgi:hypothetical protein
MSQIAETASDSGVHAVNISTLTRDTTELFGTFYPILGRLM